MGLMLLLRGLRGWLVGQSQVGLVVLVVDEVVVGGSGGRRRRHHGRAGGRRVREVRVRRLQSLTLAAESARPPPERALLEHVLGGGVDGPVVALARPSQSLGQLDEALVETEVVPHRVLPALVRAAEKRKPLLQVLIDLVQSHPLCRRVLDRHHDQCDVRVRRLLLPPHPRVALFVHQPGAGIACKANITFFSVFNFLQ